MRSLRVRPALAGMLLLFAVPTLSAQATRVGCKDGSKPKVGHFTCWGHGGVVAVPMKKASHANKTPTAMKPVAKKAKKGATKSPAKRMNTKTGAK